MPILKGDVEILGLGNLLQLLAMNHKEGVLTLIRESDRKTIHFTAKGMRLLSSTGMLSNQPDGATYSMTGIDIPPSGADEGFGALAFRIFGGIPGIRMPMPTSNLAFSSGVMAATTLSTGSFPSRGSGCWARQTTGTYRENAIVRIFLMLIYDLFVRALIAIPASHPANPSCSCFSV